MKKGFAWLSRKRFEDDGGLGSWRISPGDRKLVYEQIVVVRISQEKRGQKPMEWIEMQTVVVRISQKRGIKTDGME